MSIKRQSEARSDYYIPRFGFMENPDGHASIKGICGDTIGIWLRIEDDRIIEATYDTDGCFPSIISGKAAAQLARGRTVEDAYQLEKNDILDALGGLPDESQHCAQLAAEALKEAIGDYYKKEKRDSSTSDSEHRHSVGETQCDRSTQECEKEL